MKSIDKKIATSAHLHLQHRPLHRSAFTGAIREADALDRHRRHQRLVCGGKECYKLIIVTANFILIFSVVTANFNIKSSVKKNIVSLQH